MHKAKFVQVPFKDIREKGKPDMRAKKWIMGWMAVLVLIFCSACGNSSGSELESNGNKIETSETSALEDAKASEKESERKAEEKTEKKEENLYGEKTLDEIKEDLGTSEIMMDFGTDEDYYISDITLIKRNTKEESDNVFCTITVNGDTRQFIQDYELVYNHYTTGGWILDEYMPTSEQVILPLTGVDDSIIVNTVAQNISGDCECEIINHETHLDPDFMTDSITVSVSHYNDFCHISGTLALDYMFNGIDWELLEISHGEDYTESYDYVGTWVCDYSGDGERIRLFLVQSQDGNSLIGDYIQMWVKPSMNQVSLIEEFTGKPFTDNGDGTIFWDSQGYTKFYYNRNTVMEMDDTPFVKSSNSYTSVDDYISANYPGYSIQR